MSLTLQDNHPMSLTLQYNHPMSLTLQDNHPMSLTLQDNNHSKSLIFFKVKLYFFYFRHMTVKAHFPKTGASYLDQFPFKNG